MRKLKRLFASALVLVTVLACICPYIPKASAESREEQLEQKIAQIVAGIPSSVKTEAEKALYLHDYVVLNVAYEMVGDHQTAYGALLDGVAVCAGYADAYLRLLTAAGIRAMTIRGTADNGSGAPERHAWTMLYIDGKCLFTDVTWDDPFINGVQDPNNVSYDYFQLTMEQMHRNHTPDPEYLQYLPGSCNHTGWDVFSLRQGVGTGYGIFSINTTAQEAAKYFKYAGKIDGMDSFTCEFRFDGDSAGDWIRNNWSQIAMALGLTGKLSTTYWTGSFSCGITVKGTLNTTVPVESVSVSPSSVMLRAKGETMRLTATVSPVNATDKSVSYSSSNPQVVSVSSSGTVTALANGTAIITVTTRDGGKTAVCTVTVSIPDPEPSENPTIPTTEPIQPDNPPTETQPSDPTTETTQPTEPSEPVGGTEVTQPDDPTEPSGSESTNLPSEPSAATTTGNPADSTDSTAPTHVPGGDGSDRDEVVVIAVILGAGVLITVLVVLLLRKRR